MTESFYIRVDITSDEDLEFYEDEDSDVTTLAPPTQRKKFNNEVEKAIKQTLIENIEVIQEYLDEMEGLNIEKQEAIDNVTAKYYDPDCDLTAITEMMTQDIKFTVVKSIPMHFRIKK